VYVALCGPSDCKRLPLRENSPEVASDLSVESMPLAPDLCTLGWLVELLENEGVFEYLPSLIEEAPAGEFCALD
jgi:hypothetical protein